MTHLSLSFINPTVMLLLALIVPPAVICWCYDVKKMRRPVAVVFSLAAAGLVVGVSAWQDSLASLVNTERSLAVLVIVAGVSLATLLIHIGAVRKPRWRRDGAAPVKQGKDRYHHVWTHAAGIVAGTSGALLFADGINFLRYVGKAPAGAGTALTTTMHRVASGKAAAAAHASHGLPPTGILAIGVCILAAIVFAMRRHPAVRTAPKGKAAIRGGARGPAAIPSGPPPAAAIDRRAH